MRKIINATYMTLDGDIANMEAWGHFEYFGDDAIKAAQAQLAGADALIMGRKTYESFSEAWPKMNDDVFGKKMNSMPKYAVSSTLKDPTWTNTTVISGDVVAEVKRLKAQPGADIVQYGFGPVTRLLLDNGLLDELRIWLHPVLSGKATPEQLLYRDALQSRFTLNGTEVHGNGVIILSYTPVARPAA